MHVTRHATAPSGPADAVGASRRAPGARLPSCRCGPHSTLVMNNGRSLQTARGTSARYDGTDSTKGVSSALRRSELTRHGLWIMLSESCSLCLGVFELERRLHWTGRGFSCNRAQVARDVAAVSLEGRPGLVLQTRRSDCRRNRHVGDDGRRSTRWSVDFQLSAGDDEVAMRVAQRDRA